MVKLKKADPSMRFRVETHLGPLESLQSTRSQTQGLEAPETFWVELSEYEKEFGAPQADEIVLEMVDGKMTQGVTKQNLIRI